MRKRGESLKLIAVTNDRLPDHRLADVLLAIQPSVDAVILREKSKTDREMIRLIDHLVESGFERQKLIVHGRADIALACGIERVQLPGHGIPPALIRNKISGLSLGKSVHSYNEAISASEDGVDWVLYGHLFDTRSKEGLPARGTAELSKIIADLPIPTYAIGGIQPSHLKELDRLGVAGVAIMSSIFDSDQPGQAIRKYRRELE
ncbi:thiamine phosphate synthase [Bacillus sp. OxB-1]|uniref:thiamine phosphate synthase n=1 Tax=Bacillus sp. (strain OxB-1) TaxID=98228 RepID=UPI000A417051|nr:thiamine phosphate synthase [Bacillus sp. OxB-1]